MNCEFVKTADFVPSCTVRDAAENWTCAADLSYSDEAERDPFKKEFQRLDVYYPKNREHVPVLLYFHGGGLTGGNRKGMIQEMFLLNCVIVSAEYRLAPRAKCPDYIEDAALAAAWVKRHVAEYHGDPENIFITGQSAGAYLAAMLAADPRYLEKCGCSVTDFRGYLPLSGEMMTHFHVRAEQGIDQGIPEIDEYAPLHYVRKDFPPMLMVTGGTGLEIDCRPAENKLMDDLLKFNGCTVSEYYEVPSMTHDTIWCCVNPYIRNFLKKWLKK